MPDMHIPSVGIPNMDGMPSIPTHMPSIPTNMPEIPKVDLKRSLSLKK